MSVYVSIHVVVAIREKFFTFRGVKETVSGHRGILDCYMMYTLPGSRWV